MDEAPQRPPPPGRRAVPGLDREAAPGGCVSFPDGEACTAARSVRDSEQPDHRLAAVGAPPKRSGSYRRELGRDAQPTQKAVHGTASNLSVGIASPHPWQVPYVPSRRRSSAASICLMVRYRVRAW